MRQKGCRAAVSALMIFWTGNGDANYVGNYSRWKALSEVQKAGYVMGLFDYSIVLPINPTPQEEADLAGKVKCTQAIGLTDQLLVQAVEKEYADRPENWGQPAVMMFYRAMKRICLQHMNRERERTGVEHLQADR